ncbi:MAG: tetratricopeptide repeat protein, partial [Gammaproteobacteria bacterium]|nr:tetratricopeptide repeat protein [Gammaproteobacteria bacterium]
MEDLSEKEQLEAMRTWWNENGRYVISGIVLGVAMLAGWNYWQSSQQTAQREGSALYETLL